MKKASVLLFSLFIFCFLLIPNALAANVNDVLASPEQGWKRVDLTMATQNISYSGTWRNDTTSPGYTGKHNNNSIHGTAGSTIKFDFTGSKIILRSWLASGKVNVKIDNIDMGTYTANGTAAYGVIYANETLTNTRHSVIVTHVTDTYTDSIDIAESGEILPFEGVEAPLNLSAKPNNNTILLSWGQVENGTYTIKRSTTPGGPYTTITEGINGLTYNDNKIEKGINYYYVVTAKVADKESTNSNEATAVLPVDLGRAILVITLVNGIEKEYDLSMSEVGAFINWYDAKDAGTGPAKYAFQKTWNVGPFKSRVEFVIFSKIVTFEVNEYEQK
ncbi:hypothetical protein [Paenibacillus sp. L3-i20]|uniref:hypothetical protein n=1 Tax=Paenibacillus sp. L3-i20 TaxID=2905833 RepID=UPI001EDDAA9D|nr:hypothetical protein [Paenibacillus sp. L3-i20]GKU79353.1 hypothetical protein L3i20_v237500 [Paenibacillus sp. L3-i20]